MHSVVDDDVIVDVLLSLLLYSVGLRSQDWGLEPPFVLRCPGTMELVPDLTLLSSSG